MPSDQAHVTLDIERDSEPITGSFQHGDGGPTAFNGWIQLVSLLQDAATARVPQADHPSVATRPQEAN